MKKTLLSILLGFCISIGKLSAQDILPKDSSEWINFLQIQNQIPGLGYQLVFPPSLDSLEVQTLKLDLTKSDSGWVSGIREDFSLLAQVESDRVNFKLLYFIFSSQNSEEAVREYISNLMRNGDFDPVTQKVKPKEDLVALAVKSPYAPVFGNRYTFTADLKLFVVTLIIGFFFITALLMIISMLILKARKNRREILKKEYEEMIVDPLTNLLFEKELEELSKMKKADYDPFFPLNYLSKPLYQDVLIHSIIGLNKKMKGEFKEKLKAIYHQLGLDKVSAAKIRKSKWHIVSEGLVEINEMDLVECLQDVKKLSDSSNFHVRSLAVSALLNLSEKSDLSFLRDQTYPLSDWQQMNYLRIIKFVSAQKQLKIEMLFDSKNKSIRIFGIKLVRILGRVDLLERLASIASQASTEEKIEILKAYQEIGAHMEVDFINQCLQEEDLELVEQAIETAKSLGDENSVILLSELFQNTDDFSTQLLILKSIYELDKGKFDEMTLNKEDSSRLKIRNHVLDPKLVYV
ncbi:hypothetical protein [Algoriphagus mannitolivorans]|uniref:hypothetical protein n=1 Tax=Algoriphagus mannitolivorans TaxID=226504 RepID=UPI0003FE2D8A|nr:hypothetical protein [Algoriphagus mannitolivorans]